MWGRAIGEMQCGGPCSTPQCFQAGCLFSVLLLLFCHAVPFVKRGVRWLMGTWHMVTVSNARVKKGCEPAHAPLLYM